jgi:hypothetical protein
MQCSLAVQAVDSLGTCHGSRACFGRSTATAQSTTLPCQRASCHGNKMRVLGLPSGVPGERYDSRRTMPYRPGLSRHVMSCQCSQRASQSQWHCHCSRSLSGVLMGLAGHMNPSLGNSLQAVVGYPLFVCVYPLVCRLPVQAPSAADSAHKRPPTIRCRTTSPTFFPRPAAVPRPASSPPTLVRPRRVHCCCARFMTLPETAD